MAAHSLDTLEAKVEQLEKLTAETAAKVDTVALTVARIEERDLATAKQMDALFRKIDSLAKSADVDALDSRVTALEKEPADRWKTIVGAALGAVVAGVIGLLIGGVI